MCGGGGGEVESVDAGGDGADWARRQGGAGAGEEGSRSVRARCEMVREEAMSRESGQRADGEGATLWNRPATDRAGRKSLSLV